MKKPTCFVLLYCFLAVCILIFILSFFGWSYLQKWWGSYTLQDAIIFLKSFGILSVIILIGLQILQVVVAFIPAGFSQILAGALYGVWGGYLICMIGVFIGSVLVFVLVRKFGMAFLHKMLPVKQQYHFSFLEDTNKLDALVFFLFFIPGAPKDVLTYLVPFTPMTLSRFMILTTLARIPATITGTWAGASIADHMWLRSLLIFSISGVVSFVGLTYKKQLSLFKKQR